MKPILLIHGYASEGKDNTVEKIYGSLPENLKELFGDAVEQLDLSRWIAKRRWIRTPPWVAILL